VRFRGWPHSRLLGVTTALARPRPAPSYAIRSYAVARGLLQQIRKPPMGNA
jgi:hypothetical protein